MTKRERLEAKIKANISKIKWLQNLNIELYKQTLLLSDKKQWYKEEKVMRKEGRKKVERLIGTINWQEEYKDEDTGKIITIERCEVVKVDGEWQNM